MKPPNPESPFWTTLRVTYETARRIVIGVVGVSIILVGVAMLVLPGPAFIVIPTGLAILGAEFAFAKRWLRVLRIQARNGLNTIGLGKKAARRRAQQRAATVPAPPAMSAAPELAREFEGSGDGSIEADTPPQPSKNVRT